MVVWFWDMSWFVYDALLLAWRRWRNRRDLRGRKLFYDDRYH